MCLLTCECRVDADLTWSSAMILSPSFSSSPAAGGAVTGGGVAGLGLVSGGTLAGLFWGVGGGVSSSCRKEEAKDEEKRKKNIFLEF